MYKCVNCGKAAEALYLKYECSLKLLKCKSCNGIIDKYIEYDPVIVMINLVRMSKEAQRHILYNTEFKTYWKLLVAMMLLETYGVWRNDSLFNVLVNSLCEFTNDKSTNLSMSLIHLPDLWQTYCCTWKQTYRDSNSLLYTLSSFDLYKWQTDFGIQFVSIFFGVISFIITLQLLMVFLSCDDKQVPVKRVLKAYTLADASIILTLPMLVWGSEVTPDTKFGHYLIVFAYSFVVFTKVLTVVYECPLYTSVIVLTLSVTVKYATCFCVTPLLRTLFS